MTLIRRTWWALLLALPLAAPAGLGAQTAPRDTGLILSSPEAAAAARIRAVENMSIIVDLSDRRLHVLSGSEVVKTYPVAVGAQSYPTPKGEFRIRRMIWNPSWRPPPSGWARNETPKGPGEPGNPMGRVKIFFQAPDYYIHGTGIASSLGRSASHGCVRMRNADAVELARMIMESGGSGKPGEWYRETIDKPTTSREVAVARPVKITVRE